MRTSILLALAFLIGCDNSTSTETPPNGNPNNQISRTIRDTVIVRERVYSPKTTVYNTTKKYANSQIVQGTILEKNTRTGNGTIVCSEVMNKCARTNTSGIYRLENKKFAGRSLSDSDSVVVDTIQTAENIPIVLPSDTIRLDTSESNMGVITDTNTFTEIIVVNNDTLIVDSIVISDIITLIDTVKQVITLPDTTTVNDTLSYVQEGTIIGEIPIESWGFILGVNYIVQRNISVLNNVGKVSKVEAVYFLTGDSLAKVVALGNNGNYYSGFIYTMYNDSSFRYDRNIYNLFVRGKDSNGQVITKTDLETFSEKLGDIQQKVLKEKFYVPMYMIDPISFVPNNAEIPGFVDNFSDTVTRRNWLHLEEVATTEINPDVIMEDGSYTNYKDLSRYDLSNLWFGFFTSLQSMGCDSITFDFTVDSDSMFNPIPSENQTYIAIERNMKIHYSITEFTNNQFGLVFCTKQYARIKVENMKFWF